MSKGRHGTENIWAAASVGVTCGFLVGRRHGTTTKTTPCHCTSGTHNTILSACLWRSRLPFLGRGNAKSKSGPPAVLVAAAACLPCNRFLACPSQGPRLVVGDAPPCRNINVGNHKVSMVAAFMDRGMGSRGRNTRQRTWNAEQQRGAPRLFASLGLICFAFSLAKSPDHAAAQPNKNTPRAWQLGRRLCEVGVKIHHHVCDRSYRSNSITLWRESWAGNIVLHSPSPQELTCCRVHARTLSSASNFQFWGGFLDAIVDEVSTVRSFFHAFLSALATWPSGVPQHT